MLPTASLVVLEPLPVVEQLVLDLVVPAALATLYLVLVVPAIRLLEELSMSAVAIQLEQLAQEPLGQERRWANLLPASRWRKYWPNRLVEPVLVAPERQAELEVERPIRFVRRQVEVELVPTLANLLVALAASVLQRPNQPEPRLASMALVA